MKMLSKRNMLLRLLLLCVTLAFTACSTRSLPKYERPLPKTQFQHVRTTAYTHSEADHICHGCKTAIGTTLKSGSISSAAADWSRWPKGTLFRITQTGDLYRVDDIGWALSGRNTLDLYKPSRSSMNAWGARNVDVEILEWGTPEESYRILKPRSRHKHVERMLDGLEDQI